MRRVWTKECVIGPNTFQTQLHGRPENKVDNNELKTIVKADLSQRTALMLLSNNIGLFAANWKNKEASQRA